MLKFFTKLSSLGKENAPVINPKNCVRWKCDLSGYTELTEDKLTIMYWIVRSQVIHDFSIFTQFHAFIIRINLKL